MIKFALEMTVAVNASQKPGKQVLTNQIFIICVLISGDVYINCAENRL